MAIRMTATRDVPLARTKCTRAVCGPPSVGLLRCIEEDSVRQAKSVVPVDPVVPATPVAQTLPAGSKDRSGQTLFLTELPGKGGSACASGDKICRLAKLSGVCWHCKVSVVDAVGEDGCQQCQTLRLVAVIRPQ